MLQEFGVGESGCGFAQIDLLLKETRHFWYVETLPRIASCSQELVKYWNTILRSMTSVWPRYRQKTSGISEFGIYQTWEKWLTHFIFKCTTWKVDGPTPMYWFIMAPYKSPPFGSGDRHLLSHRYPGSAPHSWRGGVIPWHPWHLWICNNNWRIGGKTHWKHIFFRFFLVLESFAVFQGCLVDSIVNSLSFGFEHILVFSHSRDFRRDRSLILYTFDNITWATAFICNDEDKMWLQAGFVEMLVSPAKRDQNEMGGLQKRGRFKTI